MDALSYRLFEKILDTNKEILNVVKILEKRISEIESKNEIKKEIIDRPIDLAIH